MPVKDDIFTFSVHFPAMMFELVTAIIVLVIAVLVFRKWRARRTVATLYLSIALISIGIAAFVAFTGLLSWMITWISNGYANTYSPAYYPLSLPIGYFFVIPYNIFLVLFTIQIFLDKNNKKIIPFLIAGITIGILLFLPTNYWGVDPIDGVDAPSTRVIILGLFLLFNALVYILLTFLAFRESRKTTQKLYQKGFQAIAFGFIANLSVFIFFLLDSILILLNPSSLGFSIFISLAWIAAIIASFLFYVGYIMPNWFRKRYV
ncbi:MAG: hypothetical protein ACTSRC_12565 [Candidatus Helarchaeota archaeon]